MMIKWKKQKLFKENLKLKRLQKLQKKKNKEIKI